MLHLRSKIWFVIILVVFVVFYQLILSYAQAQVLEKHAGKRLSPVMFFSTTRSNIATDYISSDTVFVVTITVTTHFPTAQAFIGSPSSRRSTDTQRNMLTGISHKRKLRSKI